MKIRHITAEIRGQDALFANVIETMPDVAEKYRHNGQPSWVGSYGLKRHVFAALERLGKVRVLVGQPEPGVFHYKIEAPFFKPWSFCMTPELVYLTAGIISSVTSQEVADMTFEFRGRSMFVPYECAPRFCSSLFVLAGQHRDRLKAFHNALHPPITADTPLPGEELGKATRVLH